MSNYNGKAHDTSRIQALQRERQDRQHVVDRRRDTISAVTAHVIHSATAADHFAAQSDGAVDQLLSTDTVGLVTNSDFKARREYLQRCAVREGLQRRQEALRARERSVSDKRKRISKAALSCQTDSDEDDDEDNDSNDNDRHHNNDSNKNNTKSDDGGDGDISVNDADAIKPNSQNENGETEAKSGDAVEVSTSFKEKDKEKEAPTQEAVGAKRRRLGKNPGADTTFLPDRERELAEKAERERLKQQWLDEQEAIKGELIRITYSYWDGSGHRRTISCKKGTTVGRFLAMVQLQFQQLRNTPPDALMFIKEDLIIPHHYSFYDFVVMQARGKSGPLFTFDVVEDVRVISDATKEKEDAHAGKVVERRWYERNRHIFPASRWEVYDPTKKYERYTIHGD